MKHLFYVFIMLCTVVGSAQNTGLIVGKVMDNDMNDAPLAFANISIKGTSVEVQTDLTGLFVIENLEAGDYTLVCSFPGYETQETQVHVEALQPAELQVSLAVSTVSLSELAAMTSTATLKEDSTLSVLK